MRRVPLIAILLVLIVSLFLLSALSNILTGYPEPSREDGPQKKRTGSDAKKEPSVLLFKVSPIVPQLYCRVSTADYYTGLNWLRTTDEKVIEELPQTQDTGETKVFKIEINTSQLETHLPLPLCSSALASLSLVHIEGLEFYMDSTAGVYKVIRHEHSKEGPLVYNVSWRDVEVDDRLVSFDNIPAEISDKYLQLPNIPIDVLELAEDLEDPSYSILDQVLADVQYLRTDFVYDTKAPAPAPALVSMPQGSDVSSYIQRRKGICIDAATALAIILRIQKIPARISFGYKPEGIKGGELLYYTTGGHAVTEVYLPPYGWIQFDATPPLGDNPLVKVSPFKKESPPGSRLFYQLSITNRGDLIDDFKLFVESREEWNVEAAPKELRIEALQTVDALLEVTIPDEADFGEKDLLTLTVASMRHPEIAFSIMAITQAENILQISTTTSLRNIDEAVIRGDTFWVNGTVLTTNEQVDNMTLFIFLTRNRKAEGIVIGKGHSKEGDFLIESRVPYFMEIGDYRVIFISLGTIQYAPSSDECIIRVCATTKMELASEEKFLLGYGVIHGRLLWDNGTGFAEANISLRMSSLATPSEVWESQNLTSKYGSFRMGTTFGNPGVYEVKAMFFGNDYVFGSDATHVVELKRGVPTIHIFGEDTAIRGEVFNITVKIQFEDVGVWGEPVIVTFDNQLLVTLETRDRGFITWPFPVDSEETLGLHTFAVVVREGNLFAVHEVVVKSKTKLATKVSGLAGGMFLLFSASLSDDHDLPIEGANIVVDNYGLSWRTDRDGNLTFLLDTLELRAENRVLTAGFEGSELYLPVTAQEEVGFEPITSLPFLIPLFAPTLVAVAFMCAKHYIGRQQALQQISAVEVARESVVVEEEIINSPSIIPLSFRE